MLYNHKPLNPYNQLRKQPPAPFKTTIWKVVLVCNMGSQANFKKAYSPKLDAHPCQVNFETFGLGYGCFAFPEADRCPIFVSSNFLLR